MTNPAYQKLEAKIEVRDMRAARWFWCENAMMDLKIKHTIKLTYFGLCRYANNTTAKCYPSIDKIAEISGISRRSVIRALDLLVLSKIVKRNKATGKVNTYTLLKLTSANLALLESSAKRGLQVVPNSTPTSANGTPELSKELSKELSSKKLGKGYEFLKSRAEEFKTKKSEVMVKQSVNNVLYGN